MNHLYFFTIGPVQGFIAQARKTHDLYAGSQLLSFLCHRAIETFLQKSQPYGGEIILPFTANIEDKIPNRLVGKIACGNAQVLEQIGSATETAVREALTKAAQEIFTKVKMNPSVFNIAMAQVEKLPEIYWLFVPVEDDRYANAYNQGEKMMGAIKNLRAFSQIQPEGEAGRKCIVDGERNVVVYRKMPGETNTLAKLHYQSLDTLKEYVHILEHYDEATEKIFNLEYGEGISALTYLKRKYLRNPHLFQSTAGIALKHICDEEQLLYDAYEKLIDDNLGHTNDQLYYRENLNKKGLRYALNEKKDPDVILKSLRGKLSELEEAAKAKYLVFLKYYALISFDGDNMGEWFSGENLLDQKDTEAFHRELSKQLHAFSVESTKFLDKYGKTVYAGEDFLGFINLTSLFRVITELQQIWNTLVHDKISASFKIKPDKKLTFSAGVVIAHYKEPLGFVLKRVREAARAAKELEPGKKNRFCLVAMKHSGSELQCIYSFEKTALADIEHIKKEIANEFSPTFISKYNQVLAQLGTAANPDMIKAELRNTISRACNVVKGENEEDKDYRERKKKHIISLTKVVNNLIDMNTTNRDGAEVFSGYKNFSETLAICDFIERKTTE